MGGGGREVTSSIHEKVRTALKVLFFGTDEFALPLPYGVWDCNRTVKASLRLTNLRSALDKRLKEQGIHGASEEYAHNHGLRWHDAPAGAASCPLGRVLLGLILELSFLSGIF